VTENYTDILNNYTYSFSNSEKGKALLYVRMSTLSTDSINIPMLVTLFRNSAQKIRFHRGLKVEFSHIKLPAAGVEGSCSAANLVTV
jgi:hypothetical protein